jgi:hypothetical protein
MSATQTVRRMIGVNATVRAKATAIEPYSRLLFCLVASGCALQVGQPPSYSGRILLGTDDIIEVPRNRRKLDDYTCGALILVCDDRITSLSCRCEQRSAVDIR